jgi:uncharacterized protein YjbI with pentapeptide repeats
MNNDLPEKLLNSVEESRRSFLSKLILSSAFVVPGVASFSISGLGIDQALAACGNQFCSNQYREPMEAVRSAPGNYSGYDYSGQNFHGLDLTERCFEHTHFEGANLSGANFTCDNLNFAYFEGANLNKAVLTGASLLGAHLQGANLNGVNLSSANLSGADLTGANLNHVIWSNTICPNGSNSDTNGGTCPI